MKMNYKINVDMGQPFDTEENLNRDEMGLFGQPINDDPNTIRISKSTRQPTHKVHNFLLSLSLKNGPYLKQTSQSLMHSLHLLTT